MKTFMSMLIITICLVSAPLCAEKIGKVDIDHFLAEKKAIIKETVQFTEQENKAFWPLYDEYVQTYAKLFKRRVDLEKGLLKDHEAISEKQAKIIVDEHFDIESDSLKAKLSMVKKMRKVLSEITVLKFFQLEEKFEAGLLYQFADSQPVVK